jgi:hypothetical protein
MKQKIKLEDYSLISNAVLDALIKESNLGKTVTTIDSQMATSLKKVKEQLIPSALLAEKCFEEGKSIGIINYNCEHDNMNGLYQEDKQTFLTSEIEL